MRKTKLDKMNSEESYLSNNEAIVSSEPVKAELEVKAKIELTDKEKKIIDWHKRGQSIDWITKAFQVTADKAKQIIDNANV